MRYRAAAGVGEEARGSTLPAAARVPVVETGVNVETWRHVTDPIVMAHAFAELRYGIVAMPARKRFFKYVGTQFL